MLAALGCSPGIILLRTHPEPKPEAVLALLLLFLFPNVDS